MIERVKDFIRANDLLNKDEKILVAVSGGLDSMVLLHLLKGLEYDVSAAHVNYQLRGEDSNLDEQFVQETCAQLGITVFNRKVDLEKSGKSIQMEAREVRYSFFDELMRANDFAKVATAHHLNDSIETFLLNVAKGTGIAGLTGISARQGRGIRPLLCLTRDEILTYAKAQGIDWREDASNQESKYQRNLIRNKVVPKLMTLNPSLLSTFASTLDRLQGVQLVLEAEAERIKGKYLKWGDPTELELSWMDASTKNLVLLHETLKPYNVSFSLCKEIAHCTESGKQFLTSTHRIYYDRQKLLITTIDETPIDETLIFEAGLFQWGSFSISVDLVDNMQVNLSQGALIAHLDASLVTFPIQVRAWRQGDLFKPLGMEGSKKVSDFFIDKKVAVPSKEGIPIFESNGQIVWIGGYRISEDYKVTAATDRVLRLAMSQLANSKIH